MDEDNLQQSLDMYRAQLSHVEQQMAAAGESEELKSLVADLRELIALTEGSLLSLKKSKLLKTLEDAESPTETHSAPQPSSSVAPSIDDEYALFQASLQEDLAGEDTAQPQAFSGGDNQNTIRGLSAFNQSSLPCSTNSVQPSHDSDGDSDASSDSEGENGVVSKGEKQGVDEELSNLVGMKCCAPFSHDWGKLDYHNALVMSAVRDSQTDQILVKVMFTTPTHISMQPCKFFLDGHCRFNEDKCKFSHGQTVELKKLREFVEADHSNVTVDTKCLAQYTDGIWYPATVTEVTDSVVSVHFDDYGEDLDVDMTQVVPSVSQAEDRSDSSDLEEESVPEASTSTEQGRAALLDSDEDEEEELPVFLWKPPQTTVALGEWETYTRGIGSKLMSKMGYVPGQGLGVRGQGKAEPVPIMLLPQGKSLDRIMELKEMAGNQDLFNAMKKLEKRHRKAEQKRREAESDEASGAADSMAAPANVFDFINKKLAGKKGDLSSLTKSAGHTSGRGAAGGDNKSAGGGSSSSRRHVSEHELHKRSDKDINLQVFKTHEEIRNVERQIDRLREQLARNENKDRRVAAQVRGRLQEQEDYLHTLRSSSSALDRHQKRRSTSKKLTVF